MAQVKVYKQAEPTLPVAEPILLRLVEQSDGSVWLQEVDKHGYTKYNVAVINELGVKLCTGYRGRIGLASGESKVRVLA